MSTIERTTTATTRPATGPGARWRARDPVVWLRRVLVALGGVTTVVVATGLYLTFRYRPGARVDAPGVDDRAWLVGVTEGAHTVGAYVFVVLVFAAVGLAVVVASRRHAEAVVVASGLGLVLVTVGFVITGRQLAWSSLVWVASGFERSFDGVIGFPSEVRAILVGGGETSPARYETIAWIHIAGLPVFAVFAAWWLIGALQAGRAAEAGRIDGPVAAPAPGPARPVSIGEQFFGTDDPDTVRLQVDAFLQRHLRTGLAALDFTRAGTGIVLGVQLDDGRPAVVRLYPPGANARYLRALQDVQMHLSVQGFPAPRPLLDPQPFGVGLATVEGRVGDAPPADPTEPSTRRALAVGLAAFVRLAAPLARHAELAGRGPLAPPGPGSAFPAPAGSPFAFPATAAGAEWIEELGARARAVLEAAPVTVPVVGHFGWRAEHLAVSGDHLLGVFDWEDVGSAPEGVVVGCASHQFTIDARTGAPHVPTLDEVREFVSVYEEARGKPLAAHDRVLARTAYVYCTAYGARCEHGLAAIGRPAPTGFRERLAAHGAALLA